MSRLRKILGYEIIATLGYGARSTIFAVRDKDHSVYALKRVVLESEKDQRYLDQACHEHEVASAVRHANLRRSYKLIRQRRLLKTTEIYVLMEMVDGHTLEHYQTATYLDFCLVCQQVASGLGAMHQAGYIHADIKPTNILITGEHLVKIIDFGQSCRTGTIKERIQGTPDYIAPEQVKRREITSSTDVFNLGATMYFVLTGQHVPTMIPKKNGHRADPGDCAAPHDLNPAVPPALSALAMDCIRTNPKSRPESMTAVGDRLNLAIGQLNGRRRRPIRERAVRHPTA